MTDVHPRDWPADLPASIVDDVANIAGLRALALIGSRARGDAVATSDWDFAFVAERRADRGADDVDVAANVAVGLYDRLTTALRTDAVDVVDLSRASAVMRFRAARDGVVLIEAVPDAWDTFCIEAATFWCDAGPVIERAQQEFLDGLGTPGRPAVSRGPA
jgi:predicted nucleotidyltransferase